VFLGVLRHQSGRIAEANRARSPAAGSTRRSLTRGCGHLDRAGAGEHLPGLGRAVAHHQPPAGLVPAVGEVGDVLIDLGLQCRGQHPSYPLANDLVDQRGVTSSVGRGGSYLPDRRWRAGLA
jgi:hypothetical protein